MEVTDDESSRERGSSFDSSMEGANLLVNERRTTDYGSDGETRVSWTKPIFLCLENQGMSCDHFG